MNDRFAIRLQHPQPKITWAQFHLLPQERIGTAEALAKRLNINRPMVNTLLNKGVFAPRFIITEGSGGKTTFVYDLADCAHAWGIRISAHTHKQKAQAREDIEAFWAERIPQYETENTDLLRPS